MTGIVATSHVQIAADPERVWAALTEPDQIKEYFFGSQVETDWQPGSEIRWKGEYDGKPYEDKGEVVTVEPNETLVVTHFSPMSGQEDAPENYHTLTYTLTPEGDGTQVELTQDNNGSAEEAEQSEQNWSTMLEGLKSHVEGSATG